MAPVIVTCPVGYDETYGYSVVIMLDRVTGAGPDDLELRFAVVKTEKATGESYEHWDGLETQTAIPDPEHRLTILQTIGACAQIAVDFRRPATISLVTMVPNAPNKAIKKHLAVLEVLRHSGYDVRPCNNYLGTSMWIGRQVNGGKDVRPAEA